MGAAIVQHRGHRFACRTTNLVVGVDARVFVTVDELGFFTRRVVFVDAFLPQCVGDDRFVLCVLVPAGRVALRHFSDRT